MYFLKLLVVRERVALGQLASASERALLLCFSIGVAFKRPHYKKAIRQGFFTVFALLNSLNRKIVFCGFFSLLAYLRGLVFRILVLEYLQ
jgi:cytosine/uracil/thiamine/allantoin permease